ncbi:MAG: hypothetical protein IH861_14625 [Chloroflexi bacterium]|nr:hypothetical protein [Chloroflexota bacterium]
MIDWLTGRKKREELRRALSRDDWFAWMLEQRGETDRPLHGWDLWATVLSPVLVLVIFVVFLWWRLG